MLTDDQITSIRRHMDVPVAGIPNSNFTMGIRAYDPELPYYQQVGLLEYRMANLTPAEEVILTGDPLAQVVLYGAPHSGASIVLTVDGAALAAYDTVASDLEAREPLFAIAQGIVNAVNAANAPTGGPWIGAPGPHTPPGTPAVLPTAGFTVRGIAQPAFTLGATATNGLVATIVTQGKLPKLSVTFDVDPQVTVYGLIPILDYLESAIANSSDNAAFVKADVVQFDPAETGKRIAQYKFYRRRLATFFGIRLRPVGPRRGGGGAIA